VGGSTRVAQEIVVEMVKATPQGVISPLDARLRPDGEKGPLTASLVAYERYYRQRAQLWEVQALTRARVISGSLGGQFLELAQFVWREAGQRPDLLMQIDAMRERIRRERGSGSEALDFKTGYGGMVQAEFLVQALQMRTGVWSPNFSSALEDLREAGVIRREEATALQSAYDFLRRCESILRRWENKSVASLPTDVNEQRKLAQRLGCKNAAAFGEEYRAARETIHATYTSYFL
jgi:glutamate-ammonia-ligase adenylyltransferase